MRDALDLAPLLLHRHLGVEFVLADGTLVLNGRHAALVDRLVGRLQVGLARFGFQGARDVGRGPHGAHRHAQDLQPQRLDLGLAGKLALHVVRDRRAGLQCVLQRQGLHGLLHDHLGLHDHPLAQALRVFRQVGLPVGGQAEVHQRGRALRRAHAVGELPLHRHGLEVGRDQLEHEAAVLAADRHGPPACLWGSNRTSPGPRLRVRGGRGGTASDGWWAGS
jgi:hypothetical protein